MLFGYFSGKITKYGTSRNRGYNWTSYIFLKIGNKLIKNVWVSDFLESYIDDDGSELVIIRIPNSFSKHIVIKIESKDIILKEKMYLLIVSWLAYGIQKLLILGGILFIIAIFTSANGYWSQFVPFFKLIMTVVGFALVYELIRSMYQLTKA